MFEKVEDYSVDPIKIVVDYFAQSPHADKPNLTVCIYKNGDGNTPDPPFLSGINFINNIGLTKRDAFRDVVSSHKGSMRIFCGHINSMVVTDVGGHNAISALSPCSTFNYDLRNSAPIGFMALEDGCLMQKRSTGFKTIRIGPGAGAGPFQF